ncbi:MAG: hypothetical protein HQM15_09755 [Deltaproteobacteria bacterium]|nr:hypothetical protein [Deltaproteobacteria bacterium]
MKKYILTLVILLCTYPSYSLHAFTSTEGGFSIKMPGDPTLQKVDHKSVVGKVKENTYTLKTATEEWSVSYTPLPKIALSLESNKALLNKAKEGFLKDTGAQVIRFEKIKFQGKEARDLTFQIPAQDDESARVGKARFMLSDGKIYVLVGSSSKKVEMAADLIEKYLDSFQFLAQ